MLSFAFWMIVSRGVFSVGCREFNTKALRAYKRTGFQVIRLKSTAPYAAEKLEIKIYKRLRIWERAHEYVAEFHTCFVKNSVATPSTRWYFIVLEKDLIPFIAYYPTLLVQLPHFRCAFYLKLLNIYLFLAELGIVQGHVAIDSIGFRESDVKFGTPLAENMLDSFFSSMNLDDVKAAIPNFETEVYEITTQEGVRLSQLHSVIRLLFALEWGAQHNKMKRYLNFLDVDAVFSDRSLSLHDYDELAEVESLYNFFLEAIRSEKGKKIGYRQFMEELGTLDLEPGHHAKRFRPAGESYSNFRP